MKLTADYIVVGSGLTGATLARVLSDAGREVVILERRKHFGGYVHDHAHESGIRIHTYGPHYFRTGNERIWSFVNRFSAFYKYEAVLKTYVDGQYENWPIAGSYIRRSVGEKWKPTFEGSPRNFEEACLAMMPQLVYERFVRGYTEKQWGVPAHSLSAGLAKRFDVREDDEARLVRHKHQGIPMQGYTEFMRSLLAGIPLFLNVDFLTVKESVTARKCLVFTGPVDEFFDYDLGRLQYRGQRREESFVPDVDYCLPCGQVNNPDPANGLHIRTLEWKHMLKPEAAACIRGTVLTREIPISPTDPDGYEYPFPDDKNALLYKKYKERVQSIPHLLVCGRLGEYRYYDMDQAIGRAMMLGERILAGTTSYGGRRAFNESADPRSETPVPRASRAACRVVRSGS
jgi:UDP-galactopyranose mutase